MGKLLRLEFFVQTKFIKSFVIAIIFMSAIFLVNGGSQNIYFMGTFIIFYLVVGTTELAKRNEFNIYMSSLPVTKKEYILSKYTAALIYIVFSNIIAYIMYKIASIFIPPTIEVSLSVIIITLSIEFIYISILEPIFIVINYKYYKLANIIAVLSFIILFNILSGIFLNGDIKGILLDNLLIKPNPIFILVGLGFFIISFVISNIIYNKRDVR